MNRDQVCNELLVLQSTEHQPSQVTLRFTTSDLDSRSSETVDELHELTRMYLGRIASNIDFINEGSSSYWLVDLDSGFVDAMDKSAAHAVAHAEEIKSQLLG